MEQLTFTLKGNFDINSPETPSGPQNSVVILMEFSTLWQSCYLLWVLEDSLLSRCCITIHTIIAIMALM